MYVGETKQDVFVKKNVGQFQKMAMITTTNILIPVKDLVTNYDHLHYGSFNFYFPEVLTNAIFF